MNAGIDIVLRLRELRCMRGLAQKEVAGLSGVGEKTLSSFETGARIDTLKLVQLEKILSVYGLTCAEFFGATVDEEITNQTERALDALGIQRKLRGLPAKTQKILLEKFDLMITTAEALL